MLLAAQGTDWIPKVIKDITLDSAGVWTLCLIAIIALIKGWPALRKLTIDENTRLREDRRADYRELRSDMDGLKARYEIVERHSTAVDVRMGQLEFIIGMALDELDRIDQSNTVAKKAREMFGRLYPVPPLSVELERLKELLDPFQSQIPPRRSDPQG